MTVSKNAKNQLKKKKVTATELVLKGYSLKVVGTNINSKYFTKNGTYLTI